MSKKSAKAANLRLISQFDDLTLNSQPTQLDDYLEVEHEWEVEHEQKHTFHEAWKLINYEKMKCESNVAQFRADQKEARRITLA